jgi:VanZ family protein
MRIFFISAAWGALAFIAYATLCPIERRPGIPASVVVEHVSAFALAGILFVLAYPRHRRAVVVFLVVAIAGLELAQSLIPDRHGRIIDVLEKFGGAGLGIIFGSLVERVSSIFAWHKIR